MKTKYYLLILIISVFTLVSCDHYASMETTVHPDGRLDKVMIFENEDSSANILGISEMVGWEKYASDTSHKKKFITIFKKSFSSAAEANAELASASDTLFRITSSFEKKFRWFYTYIYYADTYHSLNRMKLSPDAYFTQEDFSFIDRLPEEGKPISKADELYFERLYEKAFDIYGQRAVDEEYFDIYKKLLKEHGLEPAWIDTLNRHKGDLYNILSRGNDGDDNFFFHVMDSLHIPLDYASLQKERESFSKELETKTKFISVAMNGKYQHRINMPWSIVRTNADSIAGNSALWKPQVFKFLLKDHTMYAEARSLNYGAVIVSVFILGLTIYLFARKRS